MASEGVVVNGRFAEPTATSPERDVSPGFGFGPIRIRTDMGYLSTMTMELSGRRRSADRKMRRPSSTSAIAVRETPRAARPRTSTGTPAAIHLHPAGVDRRPRINPRVPHQPDLPGHQAEWIGDANPTDSCSHRCSASATSLVNRARAFVSERRSCSAARARPGRADMLDMRSDRGRGCTEGNRSLPSASGDPARVGTPTAMSPVPSDRGCPDGPRLSGRDLLPTRL